MKNERSFLANIWPKCIIRNRCKFILLILIILFYPQTSSFSFCFSIVTLYTVTFKKKLLRSTFFKADCFTSQCREVTGVIGNFNNVSVLCTSTSSSFQRYKQRVVGSGQTGLVSKLEVVPKSSQGPRSSHNLPECKPWPFKPLVVLSSEFCHSVDQSQNKDTLLNASV